MENYTTIIFRGIVYKSESLRISDRSVESTQIIEIIPIPTTTPLSGFYTI